MLDFIGIGIGPFNLSLAALLEDTDSLDYLLFEQQPEFAWHAGMLLPNTTLQVPFMADLVTMVEPTNRFSFLNYLKQQDRLYRFYFLENMHIPRREYNHYCRWASKQIERLRFASRVVAIHALPMGFEVQVMNRGELEHFQCRDLVLGTGTAPALPQCLQALAAAHPDRCFHSSQFHPRMHEHQQGDVSIVGSGQSAAEAFQYLFERQLDPYEDPRFRLNWLTRSPGFFPMEYSPLGLEHFSPDYTRHFFSLPQGRKDQLLANQGLLYKGIDFETIRSIYEDLYHRTVGGAQSHVALSAHSELLSARFDGGRIIMEFKQLDQHREFTLSTDYLVAATGYRHALPGCVEGLQSCLELDQHGRLIIDEHYQALHSANGRLFLQNAELHTHGVGAPDLGLGAHRAAIIANQLLGYERFQLGRADCFQRFGAPATSRSSCATVSSIQARGI
ncbi:SidA/IucD/PvdA family monooxygenase [Pseudomonas sp. gcc21]|uniref:lysine N(6)-hydroxylase/L-ornithine N(5)-oxygenase family protein n=1 Tax=Pseudomonas sp. gcc21 TaxID=2726989 RepID=UPI0014515415|nr:SidA/IucD/PvdA family monooxygenase [Pseudomonas sp. gcc21]QJD58249.1 SidA/IucD/PvdA family monooxygenase [Pseudomonas sp. gcc21]